MDPNEEVAGVFDAITEVDTAHDPVPEKQTTAEEQKSEPEPKKTETETKETETKSAEAQTTESKETLVPSKDSKESETKTETEAENTAEDWKTNLPQPPAPLNVKTPEFNDDGQITNMNAQEYEDYLISKAEHRLAERSYANTVENRALDEVERILPEIKDNPTIRQMIENQRIADIVAGKQGDIVEAARSLRTLLGQSKAEGAQNTKVHIETQNLAAVETGNTQTKKDNSKGEDIAKRINQGDSEAFVELLDIWQEDGLI